jgi:ribosome-associated protein
MKEIARRNAPITGHVAEGVVRWDDLPDEVRSGVEALRDKKVEKISVHDLREFTPFCDFVLLGTVQSAAQARVAQESIVKAMECVGYKLWGVEGDSESNWLLIDFWDIVVHLFRPESRKYYNLEALWADLPLWSDDKSD